MTCRTASASGDLNAQCLDQQVACGKLGAGICESGVALHQKCFQQTNCDLFPDEVRPGRIQDPDRCGWRESPRFTASLDVAMTLPSPSPWPSVRHGRTARTRPAADLGRRRQRSCRRCNVRHSDAAVRHGRRESRAARFGRGVPRAEAPPDLFVHRPLISRWRPP